MNRERMLLSRIGFTSFTDRNTKSSGLSNLTTRYFQTAEEMTYGIVDGGKLAVQGRYNQNLYLSVSSCSLQGIAVRPLPCN